MSGTAGGLVGPPSRRSRRTHAIVFGGFLLVSVAFFLPADLHPTTTLIGATTADNSQHTWFLRWLPYALAHHHNPLFTTRVIGSSGVNLMWNTWIPLPALLLSPVTLLAGPVAAFDLTVTLGVALSGWAMYLATSRFVRRTGAALAAGAAYGFSPFIFDQSYAGHSNMAIAVVPPLLLLALHTVLTRPRTSARRAGLALGALLVVQFYVTEELLASEVLMALIAVACIVVLARHEVASRWRHVVRCLAWALALVLPLTAYPVWFQFFGPRVPVGVLADRNFFVTDLLNIVLPSTAQGVEPAFAAAVAAHYLGNSGEWGGYVGVPMLVVVGWTLGHQWQRPLVRVLGITGAAALLLSLGATLHVGGADTHVPLPGAILAHVPVLDDLVAARFAVYVALTCAFLLGIFVDALPHSRQGARVGVTAAVLIAASYLPPLPFPTRSVLTPAYFTASPSSFTGAGAVLVVPFSHDFYSTQAVLWQAEAGIAFSMPEGYFINRLPGGGAGQGPASSVTGGALARISAGGTSVSSPTLRAAVIHELRFWGVGEVVLGPTDSNARGLLRFLTEVLGAPPVARGGVVVWRSVPAS